MIFFNLLQGFFCIIVVLFDSKSCDFLIQVKIYSCFDSSDFGVPSSRHSRHECAVIGSEAEERALLLSQAQL